MTMQKDQNSTNDSHRKHVDSLSLIIIILQHIPIAMTTKTCNPKQLSCTVTYCPLVTAWATTNHKFQGFEAGFDPNDQFKHLIVDPGNLTAKQQNSGILYAAAVPKQWDTLPQITPTQKTVPYSGQDWESAKTEF